MSLSLDQGKSGIDLRPGMPSPDRQNRIGSSRGRYDDGGDKHPDAEDGEDGDVEGPASYGQQARHTGWQYEPQQGGEQESAGDNDGAATEVVGQDDPETRGHPQQHKRDGPLPDSDSAFA
jgi:hypothetical protein